MPATKPTKPAVSKVQTGVAAKSAPSTAKPKAAPVTVSKSKAIPEDKTTADKTCEPVEK